MENEEIIVKNNYWILRHGKSIPNERGLIVSSLENGVLEEYRLATDGEHQARLAGECFLKELKENGIELEQVRICYSPFSRTTHTAKLVASVLDIPFEPPQCKVIEDLRERFFGPSFELMSADKYAEIWALDEKDPFMQPEGGESVADVATRLRRAITQSRMKFATNMRDLENLLRVIRGENLITLKDPDMMRCTVLIVSHGDPLQILQTIFSAAAKELKTKNLASQNGLTMSQINEICTAHILSRHRKFDLNTGELRQLVK